MKKIWGDVTKDGEAKLTRKGEDRKEEPSLFELGFDGLHLKEAIASDFGTSTNYE